MKRKRLNNTGILDLQIIAVLLFVVSSIAGSLWYIAQNGTGRSHFSKPATHTVKSGNDIKVPDYASPLTYYNSDGSFSVSYPAGWQLKTASAGNGESLVSEATFTSPSSNTKLYLKYQNSYIPSDCIPDYYDKPYHLTNRCYTSEYLTASAVPIVAYTATANGTQLTSWFLAEQHFKTNSINAADLYEACLIAEQPILNIPRMGFFLEHPVIPVLRADGTTKGYISACVNAGNQAHDLHRPEVISGETILRSLRFD